jgi:hypothetical protein
MYIGSVRFVPITHQTGIHAIPPVNARRPCTRSCTSFLHAQTSGEKCVLRRTMIPTEMVSSTALAFKRGTLRTGVGWTLGEGDSIGQFQRRAMHEAAMVGIDSLEAVSSPPSEGSITWKGERMDSSSQQVSSPPTKRTVGYDESHELRCSRLLIAFKRPDPFSFLRDLTPFPFSDPFSFFEPTTLRSGISNFKLLNSNFCRTHFAGTDRWRFYNRRMLGD